MNSYAIKYVDHTYRDYSNYVEEGGELLRHKKSGNNFPARLHRMLSDASCSDVITWMPHGRTFKILDKQLLISDVIPNFYVCKKYESFSRQLNGWGFKRLHQDGPDFGSYYHQCFLRDLPDLTCLIRRLPPNLGKSIPRPGGEPNFFSISNEYPLPPKSSTDKTTVTAKPTPKSLAALVSSMNKQNILSSLAMLKSAQRSSVAQGSSTFAMPQTSGQVGGYSNLELGQLSQSTNRKVDYHHDSNIPYQGQGRSYPHSGSQCYHVAPHAHIQSHEPNQPSQQSGSSRSHSLPQYTSYSHETQLAHSLASSKRDNTSLPSSTFTACGACDDGVSPTDQRSSLEHVFDPFEPISMACPSLQKNFWSS